MASTTLPDEVWQNYIFARLQEKDLARARRVCRDWWYLINCDRFWKPLLESQGIFEDTIPLLKDDDGSLLKSCKWAQICSTYFNRLSSNWKCGKYHESTDPSLIEDVSVQLPYMFRMYNSFNIVHILQIVHGNFESIERLRIPGNAIDPILGAHMVTKDFLIVSRNSLWLFYRKLANKFFLTKAVRFMEQSRSFEACSDMNEFDRFALQDNETCVGDYFVNDKTLWVLVDTEILVYDHNKCKFVRSICNAKLPKIDHYCVLPINNYVCCNSRQNIQVYTSDGYLIQELPGDKVVWNAFGCVIFPSSTEKEGITYFRFDTQKLTELNAGRCVDLTLDKRSDCAFCIEAITGSISCWSLSSATRLWFISDSTMKFSPMGRITIILDKYVATLADDQDGYQVVQIHSASNGAAVNTFRIGRNIRSTIFSDCAISLMKWVVRGASPRQEFLTLNFLSRDVVENLSIL